MPIRRTRLPRARPRAEKGAAGRHWGCALCSNWEVSILSLSAKVVEKSEQDIRKTEAYVPDAFGAGYAAEALKPKG
ncbi:hypothetical protein FGB62_334g07 [Gracilaria domingensis]|nr:hypothetical protein FGB62_334g07 [Gracilaria domingensis]